MYRHLVLGVLEVDGNQAIALNYRPNCFHSEHSENSEDSVLSTYVHPSFPVLEKASCSFVRYCSLAHLPVIFLEKEEGPERFGFCCCAVLCCGDGTRQWNKLEGQPHEDEALETRSNN